MRKDKPAKRAKLDIAEETKSSSEMSCSIKAHEDTNAKLRREKEVQRIAEEAEEETRV